MNLKLEKRSVWDSRRADIVVVTANGTLTTTSNSVQHLSMQQGTAFEAARQHPWLPTAALNCILESMIGYREKEAIYGFVAMPLQGNGSVRMIGLFQSKLSWKEPANLALIGFSAIQMLTWLNNNRGVRRVAMNMPGQGLIGGLTQEQVLPILESILDDRVTLHTGSVLGE